MSGSSGPCGFDTASRPSEDWAAEKQARGKLAEEVILGGGSIGDFHGRLWGGVGVWLPSLKDAQAIF